MGELVLVTGGSGYIARWCVAELLRRETVLDCARSLLARSLLARSLLAHGAASWCCRGSADGAERYLASRASRATQPSRTRPGLCGSVTGSMLH